MKYVKLFENHSGYTAYTADTENFVKPNVSYCVQENECHMTSNKIEADLHVVDQGNGAVILVMNEDATGTITAKLSSNTMTREISEGMCLMDIEDLGCSTCSGTVIVTFTYNGDSKYASTTVTGEVSYRQCISINTLNIAIGEARVSQSTYVTVEGPEDAGQHVEHPDADNVAITISGPNQYWSQQFGKFTDGVTVIEVGPFTSSGRYSGVCEFFGDNKYCHRFTYFNFDVT